jgi:hypothetical protein
MAALITSLEMAAQRRGSTQLDCRHHATLRGGQRSGVLFSISFAVVAQDIRHFQLRAIHWPGAQKS